MMQKLQLSMQPSCTLTYARCRWPKARDARGNVDHAEAAQQVGQLALVGDHFGHGRQGRDFRGGRVA